MFLVQDGHPMNEAIITAALKHALESTKSSIEKEKAKLFDKLRKDYADKFLTEGISEYQRRRDELDELFMARMESIKIETIKIDRDDD